MGEFKSSGDVDQIVRRHLKAGEYAGAVVLVARNNEILLHRPYGWKNIASRTPMSPDALFFVASMTKPVTALAALVACNAAGVDPDARVDTVLPEFGDPWVIAEETAVRRVLVRTDSHLRISHLLSHTSGVQSAYFPELHHDASVRERTLLMSRLPLLHEPGTRFLYGAGMDVAARIIEVLSKLPYRDYLRRTLFNPLKMMDTTFLPDSRQMRRLARVYRPSTDTDHTALPDNNWLWRPGHVSPSHGLFSTSSDWHRFCLALLGRGERIIPPAVLSRLLMPQTEGLPGNRRNLVWARGVQLRTSMRDPETYGSPGSYGHGGKHGTRFWVDPSSGLIVIFLTQTTWPGQDQRRHRQFCEIWQAATDLVHRR